MDPLPPCPTPVCVETTAPDGSTAIHCTSIVYEGCCLAPVPGSSEPSVVCYPAAAAPAAVPGLSDLGLCILAVALTLAGIRKAA